MNRYIEHNIMHVDPDVPEGSTLIHLGTPCHTTCPYDTYARYIANDAVKCFRRAGITAEIHTCHRRINRVTFGSGRHGAVRMGDDMLPPDVKALVATTDVQAARDAWEAYRFRRFFLKPVTVVGNMAYVNDAWRKGGTWPYVRENALALAIALKKHCLAARITAYIERKKSIA